jgi:aldose sugar dehydrogenase
MPTKIVLGCYPVVLFIKTNTMKITTGWLTLLLFVLNACSKSDPIPAPTPPPTPPTLTGTPIITSKTLASGRGIIWGIATLPNGRLLLSEKAGGLFVLDTSTLNISAISGLPSNVNSSGQGGWLDVCVAPDFATSSLVYATYTISGNFLQLARFVLSGNSASNWQVLHTTATASSWGGHYGSRMVFGTDGKLYWSVGEGGGGSLGGASSPHQNGQLLNTFWGKIHRMNADGSVPPDNPVFAGAPTARSTIFSYGHRNPQGMCVQPGTGKLYATEHGPSGGCELNLVEAGKNYGWPLYSNGINYNGTTISNGHNAPGITAPLQSWSPALAPGGLTFINHPSFRDWNGRLLSASLGRRQLLMIQLENGVPVSDTILFNGIGRVRDVVQSADGKILFSVDDGRLMQITAQ